MPGLLPVCPGAISKRADDERVLSVSRHQSSDVDRFIGHRIKELRKAENMTQQQLAEKLGVSHQQVHKLEKAISRFSAGQLFAIAGVFQVGVADLLDGYSGVSIDSPAPRPGRCCSSCGVRFLRSSPNTRMCSSA
jgi:DNA-binding XRE family transcriptional regulator